MVDSDIASTTALEMRLTNEGYSVRTASDGQTALNLAKSEPPAIVILGEVVKMRQSLDWLGTLEGKVLKRDPLGHRTLPETG